MPYITFDVEQGACRTHPTEWWYPNKDLESVGNARKAIKICNNCPVRKECLMYSLSNETHGIWGGMREAGRELERRYRNIQLTPEATASMSNSTQRVSRRLNKERDYPW